MNFLVNLLKTLFTLWDNIVVGGEIIDTKESWLLFAHVNWSRLGKLGKTTPGETSFSFLVTPSGQSRGADHRPPSLCFPHQDLKLIEAPCSCWEWEVEVSPGFVDEFDSKASSILLNSKPHTKPHLVCPVLSVYSFLQPSAPACVVGRVTPFYKSGDQGSVGHCSLDLRLRSWNMWQGQGSSISASPDPKIWAPHHSTLLPPCHWNLGTKDTAPRSCFVLLWGKDRSAKLKLLFVRATVPIHWPPASLPLCLWNLLTYPWLPLTLAGPEPELIKEEENNAPASWGLALGNHFISIACRGLFTLQAWNNQVSWHFSSFIWSFIGAEVLP